MVAQAYDSDARLGFVQTGLLGFWGEWHTYPHTSWFPPLSTQARIWDAYIAAFPTTMLMQRSPSLNGTSLRPRLGFFDDSFCYETLSASAARQWFFWPSVVAAGQADFWKTAPMGGWLGLCQQRLTRSAGGKRILLSDCIAVLFS